MTPNIQTPDVDFQNSMVWGLHWNTKNVFNVFWNYFKMLKILPLNGPWNRDPPILDFSKLIVFSLDLRGSFHVYWMDLKILEIRPQNNP